MSSQSLKAVATGQVAKTEKPKDLAHLLATPSVQSQIKAALPRHMTAERMARIATTEMRKVPKLGQCDPMSFLGAVIQCAQLGLEPGNALGHAYILPFDKREKVGGQWKTVRTEAQVIIGYRGMIDLARRSGQIVSIDARAVYEGDKFECILGLDPRVDHQPDWQNANRADASKLRFVYAVAKLKDGGVQFDVMSRAEVEGIRARSKSADNGPWVTDFAAMAIKTVVRRLFKFLPVSIEMQTAVGLDEMAEAGFSQQNAAVIDGDFTLVDDQQQIGNDDPNAATDGTDAPAFDESTFARKLQACPDVETLDLMVDEIRDLPGDLRARLSEVYEARRRAISA
jgi:recombination protein RecT